MRHYPFSSAMTVLVMTIALALPMGLSVLINQVKQLGVNWQEAAQISVYLADSVSAEQQQALTEQVGQLAVLPTPSCSIRTWPWPSSAARRHG
ncbi:hypothetical protein UMZ34_10475 [Halopseudomonas pachastrellae]|nr:hypothetical protein UMZ34_10475 [Halopseudomonas pachastrellae]